MRNKSVGHKVRVRTAWTVGAVVVLAFATAGHLDARQRTSAVLVDEVTSVDCTLEKSNPPNASAPISSNTS